MDDVYKYISYFCEENENDNHSWFVGKYDCALYNMDYSKMEAKRIVDLPRNGKLRGCLYTFVVGTDDFLGITPQNCLTFCVFNKTDETVRSFDLKVKKIHGGYNSIGGFSMNNEMFFFSCYNDMPPFRSDGFEIQEFDLWDRISADIGIDQGKVITNSVCKYDNGCIFAIFGTGQVIYYDIEQDNYSTILELSDVRIKSTYINNGRLFVTPENGGDIIIVDLDRKEVIQRVIIEKKYGEMITILLDKDALYCVPRYGSIILKNDYETGDIIEIDCNCSGLKNYAAETNRFFANGRVGDNSIYLLPYNTNALIRINKELLCPEPFFLQADRDLGRLECNVFRGYDMIYDENEFSLKGFFSLVGETE